MEVRDVFFMLKINRELRQKIIEMVTQAGEGHIPSSFSIVDIIHYLYAQVLRFKACDPEWMERDFFILSKGHGCAALYVVLEKYGFLQSHDLILYSKRGGRLGGHPDVTCVPGVEASTGSLGHGFPTAAGLALGLKIQKRANRVFVLVGDGECNEGTIWETALVAARQRLGNLVTIIDVNGSADQILPVEPLKDKWEAFGWNVIVMDGHCEDSMKRAFAQIDYCLEGIPKVLIAHTIKGKGVSFVEGHGKWHHRIPDAEEYQKMMAELA
jgi:transketolase